MPMIDEIKAKKINAMKGTGIMSAMERQAYDAVISSADYQRGKGVEINDAVIIDIIKKEIKIYNEAQSNDKQYLDDCKLKSIFLMNLLPSQLSNDEILEKYHNFFHSLDGGVKATPKLFMDYLNHSGYEGMYDKGLAAKVVMEELKAWR